MRTIHSPQNRNSGYEKIRERVNYTLIEMLVVIAVIGILASILFPALGAAKATGVRAKCFSNLKQVGYGFQMYINAYKAFPYKGISSGNATNWWCHALVAPFITNKKTSPFSGNGYNNNVAHYSEVMACPAILQVKFGGKMDRYCLYGVKNLLVGPKTVCSIRKLTRPSASLLAGDTINNAKTNFNTGNMYKNNPQLDWGNPPDAAMPHVQRITPGLMHDCHVVALPTMQLWYGASITTTKPWSTTAMENAPWFN